MGLLSPCNQEKRRRERDGKEDLGEVPPPVFDEREARDEREEADAKEDDPHHTEGKPVPLPPCSQVEDADEAYGEEGEHADVVEDLLRDRHEPGIRVDDRRVLDEVGPGEPLADEVGKDRYVP